MTTNANAAGIFNAIAGMAGRAADAYRRRRTAQIINDMPEHLRKDIGFYHEARESDFR